MRSLLLWAIGIPLPIIIILAGHRPCLSAARVINQDGV